MSSKKRRSETGQIRKEDWDANEEGGGTAGEGETITTGDRLSLDTTNTPGGRRIIRARRPGSLEGGSSTVGSGSNNNNKNNMGRPSFSSATNSLPPSANKPSLFANVSLTPGVTTTTTTTSNNNSTAPFSFSSSTTTAAAKPPLSQAKPPANGNNNNGNKLAQCTKWMHEQDLAFVTTIREANLGCADHSYAMWQFSYHRLLKEFQFRTAATSTTTADMSSQRTSTTKTTGQPSSTPTQLPQAAATTGGSFSQPSFSFGGFSSSSATTTTSPAAPFTFGSGPTPAPSTTTTKTTTTPPFSFGGGSSASNTAAAPFSFGGGQSSSTTKPSVPGFSFTATDPTTKATTAIRTPPPTQGGFTASSSSFTETPKSHNLTAGDGDTAAAAAEEEEAAADAVRKAHDPDWEEINAFPGVKVYYVKDYPENPKSNNWKMFVEGTLYLQKHKQPSANNKPQYRLVMRNSAGTNVLLNMKLFPGIQFVLSQQEHAKTKRVAGILTFSATNTAERGMEPFKIKAILETSQALHTQLQKLLEEIS